MSKRSLTAIARVALTVIGGAMIVVALPFLAWGLVTMQVRMFAFIFNPEALSVAALGLIALGVILVAFARRAFARSHA